MNFFCVVLSVKKKNLTGRIRTIDLGITADNIYSPPLYQLSYGEVGERKNIFFNR